MITVIKDVSGSYGPHALSLSHVDNRHRVCFRAGRKDYADILAVMEWADFIAAVETECGGTFIKNSDLPEVQAHALIDEPYVQIDDSRTTYMQATDTADSLRTFAYALLALANYREANPPIDSAQVDALAALIYDKVPTDVLKPMPAYVSSAHAIAEVLIKTGKVTVNVSE